MDSHPRTGKRCKKSYRYNKTTKMCHSTTGSPSPNAHSYRRVGKRCKPKYRYNKSKKLCISKLNSPSPESNASYEPTGKRCRKSFRYHKASGLCVHRDRPRVNRELPLPLDRQEMILPYDNEEVEVFVSPVNSEDTEVFYSPESPIKLVSPKPNKRDRFNKVKNMGVEL
jgi:hypothetical protein